jgi:hypothetical protein
MSQLLTHSQYPTQEGLRVCGWFSNVLSLSFFCHCSSDEAGLGIDVTIHFHNHHQWAEDNPHGILQSRKQQQFSNNVGSDIVGDCLAGPHVLPRWPSGNHYRDLRVLNDLPSILDVPLEVRELMSFLHDADAAAYFSLVVRHILNSTCYNRPIGRGRTTIWPPRSSD